MTLGVAVGVGLLGGTGAVLRVVAERAVTARVQHGFPLGILLVNLVGALALGALAGAGVDGDLLRLLGGGLLGGFTTFSTWMVNTAGLPRRHAVLNVVASLGLGLAAVAAGHALG